MTLLALDMLHLQCQHQQTTFTVTAVTAKVDGRVGSVSLSLIFECQARKLTFWGTILLSKANTWDGEKAILNSEVNKTRGP